MAFESHDLSQAKKKMIVTKWATSQNDHYFHSKFHPGPFWLKTGAILRICLACNNSCFLLSLRWIKWFNSQVKQTRTHEDYQITIDLSFFLNTCAQQLIFIKTRRETGFMEWKPPSLRMCVPYKKTGFVPHRRISLFAFGTNTIFYRELPQSQVYSMIRMVVNIGSIA